MPGIPLDGLNADGKAHARRFVEMLREEPLFTTKNLSSEPRIFRLYDIPVSAGADMYLLSSDYEKITAEDIIPSETSYAVRVRGDSMEPKYYDEQIVFIREQPTLEHGEIVVFALNGESYIKELGRGELISLNNKYASIEIKETDDFRVFGKVIGTYQN